MCVSSFLDLLEYRQSVHEENRRISHYPSSIGLFSYCCFLNLMIVESEVEGEGVGDREQGEKQGERGAECVSVTNDTDALQTTIKDRIAVLVKTLKSS